MFKDMINKGIATIWYMKNGKPAKITAEPEKTVEPRVSVSTAIIDAHAKMCDEERLGLRSLIDKGYEFHITEDILTCTFRMQMAYEHNGKMYRSTCIVADDLVRNFELREAKIAEMCQCITDGIIEDMTYDVPVDSGPQIPVQGRDADQGGMEADGTVRTDHRGIEYDIYLAGEDGTD